MQERNNAYNICSTEQFKKLVEKSSEQFEKNILELLEDLNEYKNYKKDNHLLNFFNTIRLK